ncbi:NADPH-dependent FMN reductase [Cytobacillus kochii]|uniref:NADPH-dependent FMN reductase n=1 Tax=Cytobacillus kochii TaxID=859143 RepID=UPI001CD7E4C2|nr:NAD(P)H-dependent oxidoreductase [Cytobacillus kochii]MCA1025956.1 NAD(P)H-dependent oxidoreductase [Cytobacillus kochii]MCM3321450.1 NAD(P)H-dependent oxidoreductase [Cytobacillus kochii]MCM3343716.1 NAD(P)H-dependent oxidoreductase [Cytobacillus kochii]MDM5207547.1 NAD(P)H-dependent oxidoreductase [Cytobacillus kochii]
MKIAAFVGSNRKESINKKLALLMKDRYQEELEIDILPLERLPMYNQDDELTPPAAVLEIRQRIKDSDGLLFLTPEYNHSIPAFLKNAIDWFSRVEKVMVNKPAMIVGATPGAMGTVKAQMHLRQILNSAGVGAVTLPGNEVFIGTVLDKVNEQGELVHEQTLDFLDQVVNNFMNWAEKVK